MFQDLIKKTQDDIENWDWEKKKKELKAHYYKYRYHYAIATVLILIIVIIEEQNIPPIMIGGNEEEGNKTQEPTKQNKEKPGDESKKPGDESKKPGDESKKPGDQPKKPGDESKKPGDEPKKPGDESKKPGDESKKPGDEPKKPGDEPKKPGDAKDASSENAVVDPDKKKGSKGMGKGFNLSSMKGPFSNGIKGFGGGVYNMIQRIMKIIGYIFLAAFIVVIPALIYLVLVYLMFKLIVKGSIKM